MPQRPTKSYRIRLDLQRWNKFYRAFPGWGERKIVLEKLIDLAVELKSRGTGFVEEIELEAFERWGERRSE